MSAGGASAPPGDAGGSMDDSGAGASASGTVGESADEAADHATPRCVNQGEFAYRRFPIRFEGAPAAAGRLPNESIRAKLNEDALKLFSTEAGGSSRRGVKVGGGVIIYVRAADRGFDRDYHRSRDDAVSEETRVQPGLVVSPIQNHHVMIAPYREDFSCGQAVYYLYDETLCTREYKDCGPGRLPVNGGACFKHHGELLPLAQIVIAADLDAGWPAPPRQRAGVALPPDGTEDHSRPTRAHKYSLSPRLRQAALNKVDADKAGGFDRELIL